MSRVQFVGALLSVASIATSGSTFADVSFIDASLEFDGSVLDHRFVNLDTDSSNSLCVALRLKGGKRELRFYDLNDRGLSAEPSHSVQVLEDVISYGLADVRAEPGKELIFLTRSGAWSYSLSKPGYRDNIERLVKDDLLYDVPYDRALPFWEYVVPAAGGDLVLLPGSDGFRIWGPRPVGSGVEQGEASYRELADFGVHGSNSTDNGDDISASVDGGGMSITISNVDGIFLGDDRSSRSLLSDSKSYEAPALVDVDGDGVLDMVSAGGSELRIHLARDGVIPRVATRVETYPEYLDTNDSAPSFEFTDIDGDGRTDLIAIFEQEVDGFENAEQRLMFLINDGRRLLPAEPRQVMRFEAAKLSHGLTDVNEDGRPDLVLRKFELPSILETVTGLEFKLTHMVFLAEERGKSLFERRAVLKQSQVFNENNVGSAIKNRRLELDCDGDGVPDLVEVDLQGRIVIRRLKLDSGFFSGDTWELDEDPWRRFETRGTTLSIWVADVNGDGLCDIISSGGRSLAIFLSKRSR